MKMTSTCGAILMLGSGLALAGCTTTTGTDASVDTPAASASASADASASATPATPATSTAVEFARADMTDSSNRPMGTAVFYRYGNDISVRAGLSGQPGNYALHIHTTGKCDGPDFTTAGGHWNPTNKQHGAENPAGAHMGDLPNITLDAAGTGTLEYRITGGDPAVLLDTDGAAIMLHEKADDMTSDPAGNAGKRIGCGVITASASAS